MRSLDGNGTRDCIAAGQSLSLFHGELRAGWRQREFYGSALGAPEGGLVTAQGRAQRPAVRDSGDVHPRGKAARARPLRAHGAHGPS